MSKSAAARALVQTSPPEEPPPAPKLIVTNIILIGLFGVALSGWILYYTDYFEIFGGLLSLTGLFSWLAFISKVLPDERLKDMQTALDRKVFGRRRTSVIVILFLAMGAGAASFVGAVQVEAMHDAGDRALWVHSVNSAPGEPSRLTAGGAVRSLVWTSLWSPSKVRVKVSGYPDLLTQVRPWERARISTLSSFLRPVILIKPTVELVNIVRNNPMSLAIKVENEERKLTFDGHAVWIGCDDDVELPGIWQDLFRSELSAGDAANFVHYWLYPAALPGGRLEPQPGNHVEVKLLRGDGSAYTSARFAVLALPRRQDFPQMEVLDVPH